MHGVSFKKRAPRAIKEIREFAVKAMVSLPVCPFFVVALHIGCCLLTQDRGCRARKTFDSIRNSTRRCGRRGLKVCRIDCGFGYRERGMMRRERRRSFIAMCRLLM